MRFLINNYAYEGLIRALVDRGHEVLGRDGGPDEFNWWHHLMNLGKSNEEYDAILRRQIEEHRPDVYLCGKGWHFDKFIRPETAMWIRERVGCAMYWSLDDPDFVPTFLQRKMQRGYHVALSCCEESLTAYRTIGLEAHLFWPAWDQEAWGEFEPAGEEAEWDFLIVGTPYTFTRVPRREIALEVAAAGLDLAIYGPPSWLQEKPDHYAAGHPFLKSYYKGSFQNRNGLPGLFARSRINVSNHMHRAMMYLNDRVPMVMGAGQFLLLDRQPGLDRVFIEGEHVEYFGGAQELFKKAMYFSKAHEQRATIARAGKELIMREHTYQNRADFLLEILAERGLK